MTLHAAVKLMRKWSVKLCTKNVTMPPVSTPRSAGSARGRFASEQYSTAGPSEAPSPKKAYRTNLNTTCVRRNAKYVARDRKSVVEGESLELGGLRII